MCRFKSGICLKDRVFVPDYDSHSRMLEELHIEDDFAHASKIFVRIEISPADGDKTSDIDGWKLNVDQDVLPDWWDETVDLPRIKAAVKSWCDIHVLRNGAHTVRDGVWYAYNSASVEAYGSASVKACGSASVEAYDSASVKAYGSASVIFPKLYQTSKPVVLHDEAICINHRDHTIQSPVAWVQKEA